MKLSVVDTSPFAQNVPAVVLFAFENERLAGPVSFRKLLDNLSREEFHGAEKQLVLLHTAGRAGIRAARILPVGLGKRDNFNADRLRTAVGAALKKLTSSGIDRAALQVGQDDVEPVVEAAELVNYRFTKFKAPNSDRTELGLLTLCLPPGSDLRAAKRAASRAQAIAAAANYARDIGNLPGNIVYPATLADYARQLAKDCGLKCTVFDKAALEKGNFGGLLAVGSGSAREPRLIVLEYRGGSKDQKPIALVGKAITFDTGGISIKPADGMEKMKYDMAGGATMIGAMRAVAALKPAAKVICVVPATENMPGGKAQKPGDIQTAMSGKTIEVLNTDAEGRLILADAVHYAKQLGATHLVDAATLTGAIVVALANVNVGVFGNDQAWTDKLLASAKAAGEKMWQLPMDEEYREFIKGSFADIQNIGSGKGGGSITGAWFIREFAGDTPWIHLDIAGTAWNDDAKAWLAKGPTGVSLRTLVQLVTSL
jgi:leucyl aminopeptidase